MKLEEVEQAIYDHYQHFHKVAPHVQPREEGALGQLWQSFDYLMQQQHPAYGN